MKGFSQTCTYRAGREGHTHTHNEYGGKLYTYLTKTFQDYGSTGVQLTEAAGNNEKGEEGIGRKIKGGRRKQKGQVNSSKSGCGTTK